MNFNVIFIRAVDFDSYVVEFTSKGYKFPHWRAYWSYVQAGRDAKAIIEVWKQSGHLVILENPLVFSLFGEKYDEF